MRSLSIKQPWASLIAHGIKNIENRTWKTNFRGKIYIHASGTKVKSEDFGLMISTEMYIDYSKKLRNKGITERTADFLYNQPVSAIIGEVEIIDCVINHDSIWAEKSCEATIYNWVLANPVLYEKPIINVKGKLSFWDFDQMQECHICTKNQTNSELNECKRCNNYYCEECSANFNQFSQIDYNCCEKCSNENHEY